MSPKSNFFDTSAWFEYFTFDNADRGKLVTQIVKSEQYRIVTSDFIVDELFTLIRSRNCGYVIAAAWKLINDQEKVTRLSLSQVDVDETFALFQKFNDKEWSFTDCSSYLLIKRHAIPFACAFNGHFKEFGIVTVLP